MRLLGLDPGLRHTGWGLIAVEGSRLRFVACGSVDPDGGQPLAERLRHLHDGLAEVVARLRPEAAAVEETVVNVNASSSLKLGHARGVALLVVARAGLSVAEYASKRVKRALTGTGAASKDQVAMMVRTLLPGADARGGDATDALAVAICHAHVMATEGRIAMGAKRSPRIGASP